MSEIPRYWGLYCPQHDGWLRLTNGSFLFYPSPKIAEAELATETMHLWEVTEFGKQAPIDHTKLPNGSAVCAASGNYYRE